MKTIYETERFFVSQANFRGECTIYDKWAATHPSIALDSVTVTPASVGYTGFGSQDLVAYAAGQQADKMQKSVEQLSPGYRHPAFVDSYGGLASASNA